MMISSVKGNTKLEETTQGIKDLLESFSGRSEVSVAISKDNAGIENRLDAVANLQMETGKELVEIHETLAEGFAMLQKELTLLNRPWYKKLWQRTQTSGE